MEGAPPSELPLTNLTWQLNALSRKANELNHKRGPLKPLRLEGENNARPHYSERQRCQRSLAFYQAALKPLNIKFFLPYKGEGDHPDLWGFGDGKRAFFWIKQGKPDPASIHWGFMAESNGEVDEFHRAAMSAGAKDNISPRARVEYYPGYYAADVFDPDGYSFEVVHKS